MTHLIQSLKQDHQKLLGILNDVAELGIRSQQGQDKLLAAKEFFLTHLQKEDELLYPALKNAARYNENLNETLKLFTIHSKEISEFANHYFDYYLQKDLTVDLLKGRGLDFIKDSGQLFGKMRDRIEKEENFLYTEYENIS